MSSRPVVCTACFVRRDMTPVGRSFPGCPRYVCPRCGTTFLQPISTANAVVGWLLLAGWLGSTLLALTGRLDVPAFQHAIVVPLAVLVAIGLLRDLAVRGRTNVARRAHARGEGGARE